MGRPLDTAPPGRYTLADAARITGVDRKRINYWCADWGARLVTPVDDPATRGGTKLLDERGLVKVATIPKLLEAGLSQEQIAGMFRKAQPAWWDLTAAARDNPRWLDWIILIWDWQFRPTWNLLAGAYAGSNGQVGAGAWKGLAKITKKFIETR